MKSLLLLLTILLSGSVLFGQSIKELNNTSKQKTDQPKSNGVPTQNSGSRSNLNGDDNDSFCSYGCANFFGSIFLRLGQEESRLFQRNKTENRLFALDVSGTAGIGTKAFWRIQPQARLHLGWFSLEYRQNHLFDVTGNFKTQEFNLWLNFVNLNELKLRGILGSLYMTSNRESYLNYGVSAEYLFKIPLRMEGWALFTNLDYNLVSRARRELGIRIHYDFWEKGHLKSSIFTGYSTQNYFNQFKFHTIDLGVNYFLSFHNFTKSD